MLLGAKSKKTVIAMTLYICRGISIPDGCACTVAKRKTMVQDIVELVAGIQGLLSKLPKSRRFI